VENRRTEPTLSAVVNPSPEGGQDDPSPIIPPPSTLPLDRQSFVTVEINGTPMRALIDTGASDSYIDTRHSEKFAYARREYPKAIPLRMFDGSPSVEGMLMHYLDTELTITSSDTQPLRIPIILGVTRLFDGDIVIGTKWMRKNKAIIDLDVGQISIGSASPVAQPEAHEALGPIVESSPPPMEDSVVDLEAVEAAELEVPVAAHVGVSRRSRKRSRQRVNRMGRKAGGPSGPASYPNNIELPHNRYIDEPEEEVVSEQEVNEDMSPLFAVLRALVEIRSEEVPSIARSVSLINEIIPITYHEYLDLFDPAKAKETLPPPRGYDMKIKLKDDAKLEPARLYRLNGVEKAAMWALLQKELAAGRIRRCQRPYGSSAFMVPKANGEHRMVIDYRLINSFTVADAYPLPLIDSLLDSLTAAHFYTRLDLPGAYQLLRMASGHEAYTAFRTEFGMFESLVVRDGLRNAPAVFQHFLNDVLQELLGNGVVVYIDDIVIYADTIEELRQRTMKVFELLRKAGLYVKAEKCEFEKEEIKFLGFLVSHQGVRADPAKVDAIRSFPAPHDLRGARQFIGLASYYRRFVKNFSNVTAPISKLTKKTEPFRWAAEQEGAFKKVKGILSSAPVIRTFDPTREAIIQTDASFYGWGFVVSQLSDEGVEHPVSMESGRFTDTETRYTTTEKEFYAILMAFRRTKHLLVQVHSRVITDHLNLKHWMKLQQLTPRQIRWVNELAAFSFTIEYRPGRYAVVPDALSRRNDYHLGRGSTTSLASNVGKALPEFGERREATFADLAAVVSNARLQHLDDREILDGLREDLEMEEVVNEMMGLVCAKCAHPSCRSSPTNGRAVVQLRRSSRNDAYHLPSWSTAGFLLFDNRIYIPSGGDMRQRLVQLRHSSKLSGHPGNAKTKELVERDYIWPGLATDVKALVDTCATCRRSKPTHHAPYGMLKTLEVASRPWEEISMDFVEPLPISNGFDSILVVVDRLTKWAVFIPAKTTWKARDLARAFFDYVAAQHGLPSAIVSDRGSKFVSLFWGALMKRLNVRLRLSTAYQPQTDGQTERTNQALEHYLRIHCEYRQHDWAELLGLASFAYNNAVHSTTRLSPFFANYGFHPKWISEVPGADNRSEVAVDIASVHKECALNIAAANESFARFYNEHRTQAPEYQVGDKVWLSMKDIKTKRPSKKLDWKFTGPYVVEGKVGSHAYRLTLPTSAKIHNVFHVARLEPFKEGAIEDVEPPKALEVDGQEEYEVEEIVKERTVGKGRRARVEYLVRWRGYEGTGDEVSWLPASEVEELEALDVYLRRRTEQPIHGETIYMGDQHPTTTTNPILHRSTPPPLARSTQRRPRAGLRSATDRNN
jgi:transposase InsO family protein